MSRGVNFTKWIEGTFLVLAEVTLKRMKQMFNYIDQPFTPSIPVGLVKIESELLDQLKLA